MPDLFDYATVRTPHRFAIQRGIAKPISREARTRSTWERPEFDFKSMDVDDSFDVWPHEISPEIDLIRTQNLVSGAAAQFRKNFGREKVFSTRQIQGQFVRCWRDK